MRIDKWILINKYCEFKSVDGLLLYGNYVVFKGFFLIYFEEINKILVIVLIFFVGIRRGR